jgi:5'-nucleotidase
VNVLLTNDDGIDAPGLAALYEAFRAAGDVTVVAPAENQSGVGRTRNDRAVRRDHPWGYALTGTPADCVAYGLRGLDTDFDLVVSGVNNGPNAGNYVVGRSGTVGATLEAAFLGTPGVAVSAYHGVDFFPDPPTEYDFSRPARVARTVAERALAADLFSELDVLNVNAPLDINAPPLRVTRPHDDYEQDVVHEAEHDSAPGADEVAVELTDIAWPGVVGFENPFPPTEEYRRRYPVGSDRRALMDGEVSVSPLTVHHGHAESEALAALVEALNA